MTREEFFTKHCEPLFDRYREIFYETLKKRALNIGLSDEQRKDLCGFGTPWDLYTDFFSNLDEELNRRYDNGYYNIDDLFNPSTKNLESQITDDIIKECFLEDLINFHTFLDRIGYLDDLDIFKFYELFRNNELEKYIKEKIPLHSFDDKIPFKCTEEELLKAYNETLKMPLYPKKDELVDIIPIRNKFREEFIQLYEKKTDYKDSILDFLRKSAGFFNDFSDDILYKKSADENGNIEEPIREDYYKFPVDEVECRLIKDPDFLDMNDGVVDKFEWYLLEIFNKYKKDILGDAEIVYFYYGYVIAKLRGLTNFDYFAEIGIEKKGWKNYISWDKLGNFILELKETQDVYEILEIYYMLYSDIFKRGDCEQFFKEVIYRIKKISNKTNQITLGLKEYLNHILSNKLIDDNGGNKPEYFDSISEDIKEILGENEYKNFELLFSDSSISEGNKNIRKNYKIGLIFGDIRSKKAYDLYSNDKKNERDFSDRQLSRRQFNILAEEYHDQQNLDLENKLKRGDLTFILTFETDHETRLRNLMKIYPDRIIVCNIPKQHFSFKQFRKMLDLGLRNIEGN